MSEASTSNAASAGDQKNFVQYIHALDTAMHEHYMAGEFDECDSLAIMITKDVKAPLVFRARALIILASRVGHPQAVAHAKLAVKLLGLVEEQRMVVPERVWRQARKALAMAEEDAANGVEPEDPRHRAAQEEVISSESGQPHTELTPAMSDVAISDVPTATADSPARLASPKSARAADPKEK